MADDNGRKRRNSNYTSNDDFNWEEYDMMTSGSSDVPRRRRQNQQSSSKSTGQRNRSSAGSAPSRRRSSSSSRKKKKQKKALTEKQIMFRRRLRLTIFAVLFILVVIVSGMTVGMYAAVSREIKDMNIQTLALNYSSFIYYEDESGNPQELEQIQSDSNRIWIDSSQIPQVMKDAMVAIEDERFYKHHGVDIKRTLGATGKWILAKVGIGTSNYGGSTITQQVIKNITNENENTPSRKVKEMMRAIALEKQLSKDEILTMYLNIVYFANNCNGVEAAANTYFNKSTSELTLEEAASIAGITQFPSEYDPFVHPDKNIEKRNVVLAKMLELGYITNEEYETAASSDLVVSNAHKENQGKITSYFVDQVINDVINDLVEQKGYSTDFATQQVYNGGLKIYSTVDPDIQAIMEDVFTDTSNFPYTGKGAQSAMVIIDPYTGKVRGLIGGLGEKTDIRGWNRATQSTRQPGSSIKPLSVYAPAIDTGKITEVTVVTDEEITIGNDEWTPKNSYNDFLGDMTVKEAVARSSNIPAVKVLDMVGISTSFGYLQNKFHLSTLVDGDKNYSSLALGGLTEGVTVEEMAAAYGTFVNSGKYISPYTYTQVLDSTGQVILENTSDATQAISAASAYITADLLSGVVNSSVGTGRNAKLDCGISTYGKTGTTDDDCDKWFVGFTPYYVGACWYGFDTPSSLSTAGVSGNPTVTAWKLVMDRIHESLDKKELTRPNNVVEAEICEYSGMLATSTCPSTTGYFVEGTQPKAECDASHASKKTSSTPKPSPTESPEASPSAQPAAPTEIPNSNIDIPDVSNSDSDYSGSTGGTGSSGYTGTGSSDTSTDNYSADNQSSETQGGSETSSESNAGQSEVSDDTTSSDAVTIE
ncbi:MAG: PBP1A family penicillin-binding protein [Oscillospiraceae bacterium]|nr:PBP1A family penicillin-binding protein [Oscillospiraceae bacterium]